jgi:hypothetical protein
MTGQMKITKPGFSKAVKEHVQLDICPEIEVLCPDACQLEMM